MVERPLDAEGTVVPAGRVMVCNEAIRIGARKPGGTHTEPKVLLIREDGVIRVIEVVCACGELITIRCEQG